MAVDGSCYARKYCPPGSPIPEEERPRTMDGQEQEIFMAKQGESHHHTANVKDIIIIIIIIIISISGFTRVFA